MDDEKTPQEGSTRRARRRRLQHVGEKLYSDSSLRDALNDEQAEQLLGWGLAELESEVERTLSEDEAVAIPALEARSQVVRDVVRRVNYLVERGPQLDEAAHWAELLALAQDVQRLRASPAGFQDTAGELFELAAQRESLQGDALFKQLMQILQEEDRQA